MSKKRRAIVWIVDDEDMFRQEAASVIQNVAKSISTVKIEVNEWDGRGDPKGASADFIVLDLDLGDYGAGLKLLPSVPGARNDNEYGPFIIIWTRYAYRYQIQNALSEDIMDRTVITRYKTAEELEKAFKGFLNRFLTEGVMHD